MQSISTPSLPRAPLLRLEYDNLIFVGDPHMSCERPGRRVEEDFLPVVLDKLKQARVLAEETNGLIIFPGDLLENSDQFKNGTTKVVENPNRIHAGFAQALQFRECITLAGNHELNQVRLTDDTTLYTMRELGLVHVMESNGPFAIIECQGQKIGLGATPYGMEIPRSVVGVFEEHVDKVIWVTHDQFEFDIPNKYLNKIHAIEGCDMVVNGHDHTTFNPKKIGDTWWHNPGNITRQSVDHRNHKPAVWTWNPTMDTSALQPHYLKVNELAFNMTGLQVEAASEDVALISNAKRAQSMFSALLVDETNNGEKNRTTSGDYLLEDIDEYIAGNPKLSELAKQKLLELHKRAPESVETAQSLKP